MVFYSNAKGRAELNYKYRGDGAFFDVSSSKCISVICKIADIGHLVVKEVFRS